MITVAHSPDSDDFFMFWAILNEKIPLDGIEFSFEHHDTQALNLIASTGARDVVAISTAAYAKVFRDYSILLAGASVGRGYGPVVVTRTPVPLSEMKNCKIAIPGKSTTAALVLGKILPDAKFVEIPIEPFDLVFSALDKGDVDGALLIHEGQISFRQRDLHCVVDIGEWWQNNKGLPLPLGINVIRKGLGPEMVEKVSAVLARSIKYGLDNQESILAELVELNIKRKADLTSPEGVREYLGRFANQDTFNMDEDCRRAVRELLGPEIDITYA